MNNTNDTQSPAVNAAQADSGESLPEDLRELYHELRDVLNELNKHDLEKYFETGEIFNRGYEEIASRYKKAGQKLRGADVTGSLGRALGIHPRLLSHCRKLVKTYSRADYDALIRHRASWSHIVHLIGVRDEGLRRELERKLLAEKLTAGQLKAAIQEKLGKRRVGSGRTPIIPGNVDDALTRLLDASDRYLKVCHGLFGPPFNLAKAITESPGAEMTAALREKLTRTADLLDQVASNITEHARGLRDGVEWIDSGCAGEVGEDDVPVTAGSIYCDRPPRRFENSLDHGMKDVHDADKHNGCETRSES